MSLYIYSHIVAAIALAIVLLAAVNCEARSASEITHDLLTKYILPNTAKLDNLIGKVSGPQNLQKIKDAVKKDLDLLKKNLNSENIKKLEHEIVEIIHHPKAFLDKIAKKG